MSSIASDQEPTPSEPSRPERRGKPLGRNSDGRPVWEPPIFDYSDLLGDVFEKKKEAVLKYTDGDVVRTNEVMDKMTEFEQTQIYRFWVMNNMYDMEGCSEDSRLFFTGLFKELESDWYEDLWAFAALDIALWRNEDGTWTAMSHGEYEERDDVANREGAPDRQRHYYPPVVSAEDDEAEIGTSTAALSSTSRPRISPRNSADLDQTERPTSPASLPTTEVAHIAPLQPSDTLVLQSQPPPNPPKSVLKSFSNRVFFKAWRTKRAARKKGGNASGE